MADEHDRAEAQGIAALQAATPATPTPPRAYRRRLGNLDNVRAGLVAAIRGLEAGTIDPRRARVLVYAYSTLAGIMQAQSPVPALGYRGGPAVPAGGYRLAIEVVKVSPDALLPESAPAEELESDEPDGDDP